MTKETQNTIMVCTAVGMLLVGVALNIAGFIVPPKAKSPTAYCGYLPNP